MVNLVKMIKPCLTDVEIKSYEEDGYLLIKNALDEHEIGDLKKAVTAQISNLNTTTTGYDFESLANQLWSGSDEIKAGNADRFELELYKHLAESDPDARALRDLPNAPIEDDDAMFFYDAAGWRKHKEIRRVAFDSKLPSICAHLMDSSYLNFWEDTTFVKTPNTAQRTAFHQDLTYFQIKGKKCCIVWIPLDSVKKHTGAMQYIRGSHLWKTQFAPNLFITQTPMLDAQDQKLPDIELNPDAYDQNEDPDDDGYTNLEEFLNNTDPNC
jgi:ectoine hydroxylase-related dioxygenase (phytanoyl-CoA dioxygenase family)